MFKFLCRFLRQPPKELVEAKREVDSLFTYKKEERDGWDNLNLGAPYQHVDKKEGDCDDYARRYWEKVGRGAFYLFFVETRGWGEDSFAHVVLIVDHEWVLDNRYPRVYHVDELRQSENRIPLTAIPEYVRPYFINDNKPCLSKQ